MTHRLALYYYNARSFRAKLIFKDNILPSTYIVKIIVS